MHISLRCSSITSTSLTLFFLQCLRILLHVSSFLAGGDVALVNSETNLLYYTVNDYQLSIPPIDEDGLDGVTAANK